MRVCTCVSVYLCVGVTDGTLRISRGRTDGTNQGTLEIVFNGRYVECNTCLCLSVAKCECTRTHMDAHMHCDHTHTYVHTVRIESKCVVHKHFSLPIEDSVLCVVLGLAVQRPTSPADSLDTSQALGRKYTRTPVAVTMT